jgi:enamidase
VILPRFVAKCISARLLYDCRALHVRSPADALVVRGGTLFDGAGGPAVPNKLLVIEGGRITCVGAGCRAPARARTVDASRLAILPGLTDLHVHFGAPVGGDVGRSRLLLVLGYLRQRPRHRRAFLAAGVTTIRSVGDVAGVPRDIVDLKRRSARPQARGPRVYTTGPIFTAPGGHPAGTLFRGNEFLIRHATRQVDDPGAARAAVRRLAEAGVDGVKAVYDSHGGSLPRLSRDVLEAIGDEAQQRGLWVAVHTSSAVEVDDAVLAGATTIEHGATDGSFIDPGTIDAMRSRRVTYVPTLAVLEAIGRPERAAPRGGLAAPVANVRAMAAAEVAIGAGTDAQGPSMAFGASLHRELELLVEAGLSAAQALVAATGAAGAALRSPGVGTLAAGSFGDLVLLEGAPWDDVRAIRNVRIVVRAGHIVRRAEAPD